MTREEAIALLDKWGENVIAAVIEAAAGVASKPVLSTNQASLKLHDITKPVMTRSGTPVRILSTAGPSKSYSIVGYLEGSVMIYVWSDSGIYLPGDVSGEMDLVNVPPAPLAVDVWVNVYATGAKFEIFETRKSADAWAENCSTHRKRIARMRASVTVTEGQFDE